MGKRNKNSEELEGAIGEALQETERYYREQIFSSGCSSLVPIFRINDNTTSSDALVKQLQGSPYIQNNIEFSPRVIETLLDVDLYIFEGSHFFFQGDIRPEVSQFVQEQCQQVSSFSKIVKADTHGEPNWKRIDKNLDALVERYPVLESLDLQTIQNQVNSIVEDIEFGSSLESHLEIFNQPEWSAKLDLNHSSLFCMVAIANALQWRGRSLSELVMLGLLKDVGYTRLNEQIADFEVMHPLISHKLVDDVILSSNEPADIPPDVLNSILVHHEFTDGSGPLARMRHPQVSNLIGENMPAIAQISGLCDLYFGFLEKYSPGLAYSITCGFVLGQGDVAPRYSATVIDAFRETLQKGSYGCVGIQDDEAQGLINSILMLLKNPAVRQKTSAVIMNKSSSWYDRITLTLNIVRNISRRQPEHLREDALVEVLYLPVEFGLNYS